MDNIKLNLPPFYVGQRVVAIKSHTQGLFEEGDIFTVLDLCRSECCGEWKVYIGVQSNRELMLCSNCNMKYTKYKGKTWITHKAVAPIEERFISLAEVIERESVVTSAN